MCDVLVFLPITRYSLLAKFMLEGIGIDLPLLIFQIVNFLIFVLILKKYLYAPILKIISDRQKEIEKGLLLKEKMEKKEADLSKERERIITEAYEEAQLLIERKKRDAEKVKAKIIEEARKEKEKIFIQGKEEIEDARTKMQKKIQQEAINLAMIMTKKVLSNLLSEEEHHKIIQKELDKLSSAKFS